MRAGGSCQSMSVALPRLMTKNSRAMTRLVLASTSPYRRLLLERLGMAFEVAHPHTDETRYAGESGHALVTRLSRTKAGAVARDYPDALIIGSDQVATFGTEILGKPGNHANTVAQLERMSGSFVTFLTGLCLLNTATGKAQVDVVPFEIAFRHLTRTDIEAYASKEKPYDCAGGFRSEGLGCALVAYNKGTDATALVGLPMIRLVSTCCIPKGSTC